MSLAYLNHEDFDGDSAVTDVSDGPIRKYRAIDYGFTHDTSNFMILSPVQLNETKKSFQGTSNQSIRKSTPARYPLSELEISQSPSTTIKCPEIPCFISNTAFNCNKINYEKVKELVEKALNSMEEYDWSFLEDACAWKCKYLQGSNLRELQVSCYWDSKKEDHLIEVKRVKGDGLSSSTMDFYANLKSIVTNSNTLDDERDMRRMNKLRGPLPMLSLKALPLSSSSSSAATGGLPLPPLPSLSRSNTLSLPILQRSGSFSCEKTKEQFLQGLLPIESMISDAFYEIRLEASKMLCDLFTQTTNKKFLELPECIQMVTKSIEKGLMDPFIDIQQFSTIAFALFTELSCYHSVFVMSSSSSLASSPSKQPNILYQIIRCIQNPPAHEYSYAYAQMRRQAANGLAMIIRSLKKSSSTSVEEEKKMMIQVMNEFGYLSKEQWLSHVITLIDTKTRQYAMEIAQVFDL